jgi:hypothetical protein
MHGASEPTRPEPISLELRGERIDLLPQRAAHWPAAATLILSDLHLGKADAFRAVGSPLPARAMLEDQLASLTTLVRATGVSRMLVTGDLLHAPAGVHAELVETVKAWRNECPVRLDVVPGNHDGALERVATAWNLRTLDHVHREGPFTFSHYPPEAAGVGTRASESNEFTWCGHLHPALILGGRVDRLKLPCFRLLANACVLPAFSRFTGGKPFDRTQGERLFAMAPGAFFEVPEGV